jgi:hypothetical protein
VISSFDHKEPKLADTSRKAQLTAKLLQLTQQQQKALQDAIYLGWEPGRLEEYQKRGERVVLLRQQLNLAIIEENEALPSTLPASPDIDPEPSI